MFGEPYIAVLQLDTLTVGWRLMSSSPVMVMFPLCSIGVSFYLVGQYTDLLVVMMYCAAIFFKRGAVTRHSVHFALDDAVGNISMAAAQVEPP